jgi:PAS domain S-box-containing protein
MNLKEFWEQMRLVKKFFAVLVSVVAMLLLALGCVVYVSRNHNEKKLTHNRMNAQINDLLQLVEIRFDMKEESKKHMQNLSQQILNEYGAEISTGSYAISDQADASDFAFLELRFHKTQYYNSGYPVLMDAKGKYLIHPTDKDVISPFFNEISRGKNGMISTRIAEKDLLIYFRYYEPQNLYIAAVIDAGEVIKQPVRAVVFLVMGSIFFGLILFSVVMRYLMKLISGPLKETADILEKMSRGNNKIDITTNRRDEIGTIFKLIDNLSSGLRKTAGFAIEIGRKNFEHPFTPMSEEDSLGNALLEMRQSLKKASKDENERKIEDEKRRWTNEGLAKFGEILRMNNDNMEMLSNNIIRNLVKYLDANQGGLFIANDHYDGHRYLEMTSCYAYDRQKYLNKRIEIGEGITGTCFIEGQTIYLKKLPQNYINITSGLGEASPGFLLVVPLKLNEEIHGVVELASFNEFQKHEIDFVEKIGESIASTISGVKVNVKTAQLLEQSQHQSEEMKAQEEEMRQNMEEMQSTQEELQRRNEAMKTMQENLNKERALLVSLLETTEDYIYYKDRDSKFIRVSNSLLTKLGKTRQEDLAGLSDFDFAEYELAKHKFDAEQEIIRTGQILKLEEKDISNDGVERWVSTMKMPLKDENGNIVGTFGVSRNITHIKNAIDSAENIRKEMELQQKTIINILNEIPHKIYLKDKDLRFVIINQAVANVYKGKSIEDILGTNDFDHYDKELAGKYAASDLEVIEKGEQIFDQVDVVDGESYLLRTHKKPFYIDHLGQTGLLGIQTDITEIARFRQTEQENRELKAELKKKISKPVK